MHVNLILVLALIGTEPHSGTPGTLCLSSKPYVDMDSLNCRQTSGRTTKVEPAEDERRYVWISADRSEVAIGSVPSQAASVELRAANQVILPTRLRASDDKRWPASVQMTMKSASVKEWKFELPPAAVSRLRRLIVPPGEYELTLSAQHHAETRLKFTAAPRSALGNVTMRRLPEITGKVIHERSGDPVGGATISADADHILTTTNASGQWSAEIEEKWPEHVTVTAPGLGSRMIRLPQVASDIALPTIALSPSGILQLRIRGTGAHNLTVDVVRLQDRAEVKVGRRETKGDDAEILVPDLAPGKYRTYISGPRPLQRYAHEVSIESEQITDETITIKPADLEIKVTQGEKGVPADIEMKNASAGWTTNLRTDASGTLEEWWQPGDFGVAVSAEGRPAPYFTHREVDFATRTWLIQLPNKAVRGIVRDARTTKPIPDARIILEVKTPTSESMLNAITNETGLFEFSFIDAGTYRLKVSAPGYLSKEVPLPDPGEARITITLDRGRETRVLVETMAGLPAAGALIVDESGNLWNPILTDATGSAVIITDPQNARKFFVFPKEGSFATFAVSSEEPSVDPRRIAVPPGEATLIIRLTSVAGMPLSNIRLLLAFNGEMITPAVQEAMFHQQGRRFVTDSTGSVRMAHLPVGLYEIWPLFEPENWGTAVQGRPAARVAAQRGENLVTLTFSRD